MLVALPISGQQYKPDDVLPAGAKGKVLAIQGKVLDLKGLSQNVAGKVDPVTAALQHLQAKTSGQEIHIELSSDVLFDFAKADLRPPAIPILQELATVLKAQPQSKCTIDGHSDDVGNETYNQKLSEKRATAVKSWLQANGVSRPITTRGWGATKPVAPNKLPNGADNPEGRQKNRRVEITIEKG